MVITSNFAQLQNRMEVHGTLVGTETWWRHQMEAFSASLAICARNSPVPGEFPAQRPVTRSFDVYFDLRWNKRFSKQSWGWGFGTPSRSLWRHCNEKTILIWYPNGFANLSGISYCRLLALMKSICLALMYAVWCRYNAVNSPTNIHKRPP